MLKNYIFPLLLLALCLLTSALGQEVHTPSKDSAERKAVLNALRVPVERELKKKTIFEIQTLNVEGNWAFLDGIPKKGDGSAMDYRNTIYQQAIKEGIFGNGVVALLKKSGASWRVVKYVIGPTDVPYVTWWKDYKAPKTIFPHTE